MNRWEHIKAERAAKRKRGLIHARDRIAERARSEGLEIRVFGSLARDRISEMSDLDILVMPGFDPDKRYSIMAWMSELAAEDDVPIDVAFADVSPELARDSVPCP
ncbi:nucleotidyltransferase domain-containing protein [Epibacterium sp. DP7N7-1]|nr:nucleotidyltransferase domain-containing protein [Epibacterium sp. DP7N7-1]